MNEKFTLLFLKSLEKIAFLEKEHVRIVCNDLLTVEFMNKFIVVLKPLFFDRVKGVSDIVTESIGSYMIDDALQIVNTLWIVRPFRQVKTFQWTFNKIVLLLQLNLTRLKPLELDNE